MAAEPCVIFGYKIIAGFEIALQTVADSGYAVTAVNLLCKVVRAVYLKHIPSNFCPVCGDNRMHKRVVHAVIRCEIGKIAFAVAVEFVIALILAAC